MTVREEYENALLKGEEVVSGVPRYVSLGFLAIHWLMEGIAEHMRNGIGKSAENSM
jgi:hypothetical protein